MSYKLNPFTGLLDRINENGEVVSFNGEITDPSGSYSGNSTQDFINLFFQSVDPSVSLSISPYNSLREYGNNVVDPTLTASFTEGSNPVASISNYEYFRDGTSIHTGDTNNSYQDTNTVSNRTVYKVIATDTENRTASSSKTYSFVYPYFQGVASSGDITNGISENDLNNLSGISKNVSNKGSKTVTSSPSTERFVFLYPSSYGSLYSIIDDNGFETISDYNINDIDITSMIDGTTQTYKFYELKSDTTQDSFSNQFKI